jgi:hypothetical protein
VSGPAAMVYRYTIAQTVMGRGVRPRQLGLQQRHKHTGRVVMPRPLLAGPHTPPLELWQSA